MRKQDFQRYLSRTFSPYFRSCYVGLPFVNSRHSDKVNRSTRVQSHCCAELTCPRCLLKRLKLTFGGVGSHFMHKWSNLFFFFKPVWLFIYFVPHLWLKHLRKEIISTFENYVENFAQRSDGKFRKSSLSETLQLVIENERLEQLIVALISPHSLAFDCLFYFPFYAGVQASNTRLLP